MHSGRPLRASAAPDVARDVALRVEGRCAGRGEPEAVPAWGSLLLTADPSCPQCTLALFVSSATTLLLILTPVRGAFLPLQ